jgi:hypothetical protein
MYTNGCKPNQQSQDYVSEFVKGVAPPPYVKENSSGPYGVSCPASHTEHYSGLGCAGCRSAYMPSGETWGTRHRYGPSDFNPFMVSGEIPYGPRGGGGCVPSGYVNPSEHSKENFYASSSSSWTQAGNVTPANGITWGKHMKPANHPVKESCCGPMPYQHLQKTWTLPKENYCCGATPYSASKDTWFHNGQ